MDIDLVDITIHIDEELDTEKRSLLEQYIRQHKGVVSVHYKQVEKPHLMVVLYNPDETNSQEVLTGVRSFGWSRLDIDNMLHREDEEIPSKAIAGVQHHGEERDHGGSMHEGLKAQIIGL
ncbi:MAG: hypothetical protein HQL50_11110 [Magnetococcales bacterium]|nr:hypothetical protein [Magnetococcales bacterium]